MSILLQRDTVWEAWRAGILHLCTSCEDETDYNVVLEIARPLEVLPAEVDCYGKIDALLVSCGKQSLRTVANTIFPEGLVRRHGAIGFFNHYPEVHYPRLRRLKENKWGTYAHRLVRRTSEAGTIINPLNEVIRRLKTEAAVKKGHKRARYELNLIDPFTDLATADPALAGDSYSMGGPCLSHLSFKLDDDRRLRLIAFYRSHYYFERALGNLIGLAELLKFVAREVGVSCGPLTCISSYAQIDQPKGVSLKAIKALVQ